jgi:hypothetical protein
MREEVTMVRTRLLGVNLAGAAFAILVVGSSLGTTHPAALGQTSVKQEEVTFSRDVAPIVQRACQNCHRPGSIAPMSLLTYSDARPWARAI